MNRRPEPRESNYRQPKSRLLHFFRRPNGDLILFVRKKINREWVEEEFTHIDVEGIFDSEKITSRIFKLDRRPNGLQEIIIKCRIHGETIEERWTQREIDMLFENA